MSREWDIHLQAAAAAHAAIKKKHGIDMAPLGGPVAFLDEWIEEYSKADYRLRHPEKGS